jgi:hypothetical protein
MSSIIGKLDADQKSILSELRARLMELDKDVLEQVRQHRIVYSKGFFMRDFGEITFEGGRIRFSALGPKSATQYPQVLVENESELDAAVEMAIRALHDV